MRIISKFHDYYDTVSTYGMDLTCIYKRKEITFEDDTVEYKEVLGTLRNYGNDDLRIFPRYYDEKVFTLSYYCVILFCGGVYPLTVFKYKNKYFHYYDIATLHKDIMRYGSKEIKKEWLNKKRFYFNRNITRRRAENLLNINIPENTLIDLHHKYKSPILMYDGDYSRFIINPNLKKYKFYRVKDAYTTYQDISMFLGGILGGTENKIVELSDRERKEKHGFNEWSFRKPPER
jgi:hypothetical protein